MTSAFSHVPAALTPAPTCGAPAFVDPSLASLAANPVAVVVERLADVEARESLLDRAFGPARFAKTCERLRGGRLPAAGLSLVARARGANHRLGGANAGGDLVGTVRLWHIEVGGMPALMLGPLAVDAAWRCHRVGARLMKAAIERARDLGHESIVLVGDAPYYARFGFERRLALGLRMPGPVEAERLLGIELVPGALTGAAGAVRATGAIDLGALRRTSPARLRPAA